MGLLTTKPVAVLQAEAELAGESPGGLRRVLGPVDLLLLGVGAILGLGGIALTGALGAHFGGSSVTLAFVLAGVACLLSAVCFAELASAIPATGGPYAWAYAALGELPAWLVAWCLLVEYVLGAATVAVGWSRHLVALVGEARLLPISPPDAPVVHLLAALLVAVLAGTLLGGVRAAARLNAALAVAKLLALAAIIALGARTAQAASASALGGTPSSAGALATGWLGVASASGAVFFAYVGFDAVAAVAGEARRPRQDVPRAIVGSLALCGVLYVLLAIVVSRARSTELGGGADPVAAVLRTVVGAGSPAWAAPALRAALLVGLAGVVLVLLLAAARVVFAMARDGLLPAGLGAVSPRAGSPRAATLVVGGVTTLAAAAAPLDLIGDVVTGGSLLVVIGVSATLLALRRRRPELERPFRVRAAGVVASLAALVAVALLVEAARHALAPIASVLFAGLLLYFGYGQAHSRVRRVAAAAAAAAE